MARKLLSLNNIGLKGVNSDIKPWELGNDFVTQGINFRLNSGSIDADGGSALWGTDGAPFNPGHALFVRSTNGDFWLLPGRSAVKAWNGSAFSDVSSIAGYAGVGADDELLWTSCMLGQIPIINNPQAQPEYWSPQNVAQVMQPLQFDAGNTWTAANKSFKVIRAHKNFLFALNLTEGGIELPNSYRWSHPADINGLPFSWDEADPSSLASIEQLGGASGAIIDGHTLRDAFCIYSENATNILDFTGDNFVFRRRTLSETFGLLTANCVAEIKGMHLFLGDGDIVRNDGTDIVSILHNRLRKRLISSMSVDSYDRSFVVQHPAKKEVWFCVPESDAEYPNVAYIYNWRDDSWAIRDLPDNIAFAGYGVQANPTLAWDDWQGTWDSQVGVWGSNRDTPLNDTIVAVKSSDSTLHFVDATDNSTDLNSLIERTGLPMDTHNDVTTITAIYPKIESEGSVILQFGSQDHAGSPVRWKPEITFNPNTERKVNIRTTGELHCWRIKSIGTTAFSLSGFEFEYVDAGRR